jgi:hypothetical protein
MDLFPRVEDGFGKPPGLVRLRLHQMQGDALRRAPPNAG